jgi:hypothetical protein
MNSLFHPAASFFCIIVSFKQILHFPIISSKTVDFALHSLQNVLWWDILQLAVFWRILSQPSVHYRTEINKHNHVTSFYPQCYILEVYSTVTESWWNLCNKLYWPHHYKDGSSEFQTAFLLTPAGSFGKCYCTSGCFPFMNLFQHQNLLIHDLHVF